MELGQKVKFKIDYVKSGQYVDPEKATDEQIEDVVTLNKYIPREHPEAKEGIICGKRYYAIKVFLDYDPDRERFDSIGQEYDTFYLVACNLVGFHKVRHSDLIDI